MKINRIILIFTIFIMCFIFTGCSSKKTNKLEVVNPTFIEVKANSEGKIVIDTTNVTSKITLANYEVDGVIIQLILVRGTDGVVRIAFNTCQACNPSPNAYFIQKGVYLECQNCGSRFHIDNLGIEENGCNPYPVLEKEIEEEKITIDKEYIDSFKEKFENWDGVVA